MTTKPAQGSSVENRLGIQCRSADGVVADSVRPAMVTTLDTNFVRPTRTISEAASKNRGRPAVWPEKLLSEYSVLFPGARSHRALVDVCYQQHAQRVLLNASQPARFEWLLGGIRAGGKPCKPSVLAELGRMRDSDTIVLFAEKLCIEKPAVKVAVASLRRVRAQRRQEGQR